MGSACAQQEAKLKHRKEIEYFAAGHTARIWRKLNLRTRR
jgi:hypothetical protein